MESVCGWPSTSLVAPLGNLKAPHYGPAKKAEFFSTVSQYKRKLFFLHLNNVSIKLFICHLETNGGNIVPMIFNYLFHMWFSFVHMNKNIYFYHWQIAGNPDEFGRLLVSLQHTPCIWEGHFSLYDNNCCPTMQEVIMPVFSLSMAWEEAFWENIIHLFIPKRQFFNFWGEKGMNNWFIFAHGGKST